MCIILLLVIYIQQKVTYSDNLPQTLQNKALSTESKKKKKNWKYCSQERVNTDQVYCGTAQYIYFRIKNNPNNRSFSKTKWNFDMNLSLIYISGLAHFCCQSLFYQRSNYKNWKSALPWGLNKEKNNKWVSFLLLYLSTTTRLIWILAVCNQSLMFCNNTAILPNSP